MARTEPRESKRRDGKPRRSRSALVRHLAGRVDPLTSAILVFPLFLVYQLGILTGRGQNGVDFVTSALIEVSKRDLGNYLVILTGMLLAYAAILIILRRFGSFDPRAFVPVLLESGFYAATMGTLILYALRQMLPGLPGLFIQPDPTAPTLAVSSAGPLDILVISAGAGLHEELIFRVVAMGGLAWLLAGITGRRTAWLLALVLSSVLFSLAHHVGPMGEPFTFMAFAYRILAGAFFALVYQVRGFAVAAWTHALYDVYVLTLQ